MMIIKIQDLLDGTKTKLPYISTNSTAKKDRTLAVKNIPKDVKINVLTGVNGKDFYKLIDSEGNPVVFTVDDALALYNRNNLIQLQADISEAAAESIIAEVR